MAEHQFNTQEENWKDIPGYEPYQASNLGRVRNGIDGEILLEKLRAGYPTVYVCKKQITVHRLVALTFLGPLPPGHITHHKDHVKSNNFPENLIYVTHKGHSDQHPERYNNLPPHSGELNVNAKLTVPDVILIRRLNSKGWNYKELAEEFGVIWNTVRKVCKREIWKHV